MLDLSKSMLVKGATVGQYKINMLSYQLRDTYNKDKTVMRLIFPKKIALLVSHLGIQLRPWCYGNMLIAI